jgi:hypothetical protein
MLDGTGAAEHFVHGALRRILRLIVTHGNAHNMRSSSHGRKRLYCSICRSRRALPRHSGTAGIGAVLLLCF